MDPQEYLLCLRPPPDAGDIVYPKCCGPFRPRQWITYEIPFESIRMHHRQRPFRVESFVRIPGFRVSTHYRLIRPQARQPLRPHDQRSACRSVMKPSPTRLSASSFSHQICIFRMQIEQFRAYCVLRTLPVL